MLRWTMVQATQDGMVADHDAAGYSLNPISPWQTTKNRTSDNPWTDFLPFTWVSSKGLDLKRLLTLKSMSPNKAAQEVIAPLHAAPFWSQACEAGSNLVAGTGNKCPSACCLAKITNTYFVACDGDPTMSRVAPWLETSPGMPCQRWAALTLLDWRELKGEQTNAVALGKQHYSTRGWCSMSQRTSQKTAIMKNSRKQLLKLLKQLVNLLKQQFHGKNNRCLTSDVFQVRIWDMNPPSVMHATSTHAMSEGMESK